MSEDSDDARYLAPNHPESIVNANRVHAHGTFKLHYRSADGITRMGDYRESMTVREPLGSAGGDHYDQS